MKRNLLGIATGCLMLAAGLAGAQTTYTWTGATDTAFTTTTNWSPNRTLPATNDILVFDGGTVPAPSVTALPAAQTIGELHVINAANVVFAAPAASAVLTIAGGAAAADFEVAAGSKFTYTANAAIVTSITLQTGAKAQIFGDVVHTGTGNGNANKFTSPDVDGIVFESGSTFQFAPGGTGGSNPFGNTNNQSVRFKSGATAYQGGTTTGPSLGTGSAMQAGTLPTNVIVWDPGSTYYNWTSVMAGSGRTYANVVLDNRGAASTNTGTSTLTINGNLTYKGTAAAAYNWNLSANPAMIVTGDVIVEPNGRMGDTFALVSESRIEVGGNINIAGPNATLSTNAFRVWTLNGSGTQTVTMPAGINFPALRINKGSGNVTLSSDVTVTNALDLQGGLVTTGANVFRVNGAVNQTAGYVSGTLTRPFDATVTGARTFAVGTATKFTPVIVDITSAGTGSGTLAVTGTDGTAANLPPAVSSALLRSWTITESGISGYTATLTFDYDLGDVVGAEASYVAARYTGSGTVWNEFPGTTTIDTINHNATVTGVTQFSPWTLYVPAAGVADWMMLDN